MTAPPHAISDAMKSIVTFVTSYYCAKPRDVERFVESLQAQYIATPTPDQRLFWPCVYVTLAATVGASIVPAIRVLDEILRRDLISQEILDTERVQHQYTGLPPWVVAVFRREPEEQVLQTLDEFDRQSSRYACEIRGVCQCETTTVATTS